MIDLMPPHISGETTEEKLDNLITYVDELYSIISRKFENIDITDLNASLASQIGGSSEAEETNGVNREYVVKSVGDVKSDLNSHAGSTDVHLQSGERASWNAASTHASTTSYHFSDSTQKSNVVNHVGNDGDGLHFDSSLTKTSVLNHIGSDGSSLHFGSNDAHVTTKERSNYNYHIGSNGTTFHVSANDRTNWEYAYDAGVVENDIMDRASRGEPISNFLGSRFVRFYRFLQTYGLGYNK